MQIKAYLVAERMGFEPMKELLLYTLSKRAPSTTRPPLHIHLEIKIYLSIFINILESLLLSLSKLIAIELGKGFVSEKSFIKALFA